MTADRLFFLLGAVSAFISVAAGAFGAHGLRGRLEPPALAIFETAARYQMYHALALFAVAWAVTRWPGPWVMRAGWLFVIGTVIFSGSLYTLAISGVRAWGAVTPFGGLSFIAGWLSMVVFRHRRH